MIGFSQAARERIREFIEEEGEEGLSVGVAVVSSSPLAPEYDLALVEAEEVGPGDQLFESDGLRVAVDAESVALLEGTEIDWVESLQGSGFRFNNPNLKPIGSGALEGPMADRVKQVIDERINPGIASHGGHVSQIGRAVQQECRVRYRMRPST